MNTRDIDLKRETLFKDAVLSQAEARSMEIIAAAGRRRAEALNAARASCELADPALISARLSREARQRFAAISGEAHRELLAWREGLVADLFADVEKRLAAFTQTDEYAGWLLAKLEKHRDFTKQDGEGIFLVLREEDAPLAGKLQSALPKAEIVYALDIRLGGVRISNGKMMHNETLDAAMDDQRQAFYQSGKLRL